MDLDEKKIRRIQTMCSSGLGGGLCALLSVHSKIVITFFVCLFKGHI